MPKLLRRFSILLVLLGAWAIAGSDRAPLPLTSNETSARPAGRSESYLEGSRGDRPSHELTSLRIFTKVILYVKDNYVDPKRVKPKEMMLAALEYVEKSIPDVIVDGSAESGKLKVTVNGKSRDFDISHVDSLWKMSFTIKDVFDYISKNMRPIDDTREVEYAAVNGMLSTLDPHSVLLRPDLYREMKLTTKGEFGGLGFIVQMREGNLTVVKVLAKTPAYRAGIKRDDTITRIGEESTVNMDLNEAVSKLRGPVDSKVNITVERKGWERPQPMTVTRAMINIESVHSKLLAHNVGYIQLGNFQGNTHRDLQASLADLAKQAEKSGGMKGLVLDLRGNPGGLLEQAIQVSDAFLSQGTIVSTVGLSDKLREEKKAHPDEGDNLYPIAVLVDTGSASASEIVAGALKNLNRAVVIGRQTFGKGSVQVLYEMDDSALKLTIAKYLTPGDISIQEIGVVPDIALIPTQVTADRISLFAPRRSIGEADLEHHFGNPTSSSVAKKREEVVAKEKPAEQLKYLKVDSKSKEARASADETKLPLTKGERLPRLKERDRKEPRLDIDLPAPDYNLDDPLDPESQDEIREDFEILFARDFIVNAPFVERDKMLKAAHAFVEKRRQEEEQRISAAIEALGIDWSAGPSPKNPQLIATLRPGPDEKIVPGETVKLELTAENKGTEAIKRLRAWTESENLYLDRREFVFGTLLPGQKRTWTTKLKLPKDLISRRDEVKAKFFDDQGPVGDGSSSELNVVELPRPAFAFDWQVMDECQVCNGDGFIQRGERVELLVDVRNVGRGKATDAYARIKNGADQNVFIEKGRFKLGDLAPGETKTARFVLEVKKGYRGASFPLDLAIVDEPLQEVATAKLELGVSDSAKELEPRQSLVRISDKTHLFGSPLGAKVPFAVLPKGAVLTADARLDGFYKVSIDKDRFAFVSADDVKEVKGIKASPPKAIEFLPFRDPPLISLNTDATPGAMVVNADRFSLSGTVTDPKSLLDMYVLVNDKKVFFKGAPLSGAETNKLGFATDFPLKEGNNYVVVVARESPEFGSRRALVIRRRPAEVARTEAVAPPKP